MQELIPENRCFVKPEPNPKTYDSNLKGISWVVYYPGRQQILRDMARRLAAHLFFHKYKNELEYAEYILVIDGQVVHRFATTTHPTSAPIAIVLSERSFLSA